MERHEGAKLMTDFFGWTIPLRYAHARFKVQTDALTVKIFTLTVASWDDKTYFIRNIKVVTVIIVMDVGWYRVKPKLRKRVSV